MRILFILVLVGFALTASVALTADRHVTAPFNTIDGSGVTGFVELTQLPHGGTNLHVVAHGLTPGTVYASFYYESSDCSAAHDLLGTFTANAGGEGEVNGKIDDDLDEVGSVSVRLGPEYGTLLACASVH